MNVIAFFQIGKHGIIIEFTDPDNSTRRSATYLPEVAAHEGEFVIFCLKSLLPPRWIRLSLSIINALTDQGCH